MSEKVKIASDDLDQPLLTLNSIWCPSRSSDVRED